MFHCGRTAARPGFGTLLAAELSAIKSLVTVNTSPVAQAVIGGVLVSSGHSLRTANQRTIAFYRRNMQTMLTAPRSGFGEPGTRGVSWNIPDGGFFAVVTAQVRAGRQLLEVSAREYGVLWTPMSLFYLDGGGDQSVRLSCSFLAPDEVSEGVHRFAKLITDQAP